MKQKNLNKLITALIVMSLVTVFGFPPLLNTAKALDSITDASDTITDSDSGVAADHAFAFTRTHATPASGYVNIVFANEFGDVVAGDITCPGGWTRSAPNTETARCTADALEAAGAMTVDVAGIDNPVATGTYIMTITNYDNTGAALEWVQVRVAIISDVLMTARVDATLTFTILGLVATTDVNGVACTENSTSTTTPFGTLPVGSPQTVCQELRVATNADDGFNVVVWEDDEMTSDSLSNINSFNNSPDNSGSSTPQAWAPPENTLDNNWTYGHMGFTSEDSTLSWGGGDPFGASLYVGFNANNAVEVMYHTGPADGSAPDKGLTQVAYTAEISALQEAGDYENTLTYIATPIY
jgi:hypothetical protein